jgi:uncharacterized protein (DUF1501 family)
MNKNLSTRRVFIQRGLALLAVAPTVPSFLDQTVWALSDPLDMKQTQQDSGKDGKILVVVQLSGGNDGLSTVIPYGDDVYYRQRTNIGVDAKSVLRVNNYVGLHPNLKGLYELLDNGRVSVVQGVGYPNPNRSHFRAMDIWQSAVPERENVSSGWLGRYFDNTCSGCDPHVGVSIGDTLPLAMHGERVTPLSFEKADSYKYKGKDVSRYNDLNKPGDPMAMIEKTPVEKVGGIIRPAAPRITPANQVDFLERTALDAQVSSSDILRMTSNHQPSGDYPNDEFGQGLRTIAAMIGGGLPTRVYYVSLTGFDTHANQKNRHDQLMKQLSDGISAFWKDMQAQKNDDRVLMMTFSEFGRRVQQNASNGTDHGAAAPMFLIGPKLRAGVLGNHPSLTDLDQGDLKYLVDFRNVYATVLQEWLETPSKPILGQQFRTMDILKA